MKSISILSMLAAAALTACGGGGSTSSNTTATLTGKVMDGYIKSASVCLDLNKNDLCDANEPFSVSGADGSYSLIYPISASLADTPIIVTVPVGAVDSVDGTVTRPYLLRTMATAPGVISPFTTIAAYELKFNPGKTFAAVASELAQRLLGNNSTDITADYMASNRADLLAVARALVASMQIGWGTTAPAQQQYQDFSTIAPSLAAWAVANQGASIDQIRLKAAQLTVHEYTVGTLPISLGTTTPTAIAVDGASNFFFASGHDLMKVAAGSSTPTSILFDPIYEVSGVAAYKTGDVYALTGNNVIKVPKNGPQSVLAGTGAAGQADGPGKQATFNSPKAITVAPNGLVYVADTGNSLIRIVNDSFGDVTTFTVKSQPLVLPGVTSLAVSKDNQTIYTISPAGIQAYTAQGLVWTYKGDSVEQALPGWSSLVTDGAGQVFVTDVLRSKVWRILETPNASPIISLLAGTGKTGKTDGLGSVATFSMPYSLAIDDSGTIYINDLANRTIRYMR
jgi:hypothetical protein